MKKIIKKPTEKVLVEFVLVRRLQRRGQLARDEVRRDVEGHGGEEVLGDARLCDESGDLRPFVLPPLEDKFLDLGKETPGPGVKKYLTSL